MELRDIIIFIGILAIIYCLLQLGPVIAIIGIVFLIFLL